MISTSKHFLIEFVGLPGSGKTTISQQLNWHFKFLSEKYFSQMWRRKTLFRKTVITCRALGDVDLVIVLVKIIIQNGFWKKRDALVRLIKIVIQKHFLKDVLQKSSFIFDQGFLQSFWSAHLSVKSTEICLGSKEFLNALYRGINVIFVSIDLPDEISATRLAHRQEGESRLDGLDEQNILLSFQRYGKIFKQVKDTMQALDYRVISQTSSVETYISVAKIKEQVLARKENLKILYVAMKFPIQREAFFISDVMNLVSVNHRVIVASLMSTPKENLKLLKDYSNRIKVMNPVKGNFICGILFGLMMPLTMIKLISWCWKNRGSHLKHFIKSCFLIPQSIKVLRFIEKESLDVVHLFWGHYPAVLFKLIELKNNRVVKTMFLGAYDLLTMWPGSASASNFSYRVFTHANANRPQLEKLKIQNEKIVVVHRGISLPVISEKKKNYQLIIAAAMIPAKGHRIVIELLAILKKINPAYELTISGSGECLSSLQAQAVTLGLTDSIHFTGHISQTELYRKMQIAKFFILPTIHESERLPNVVKEAMANGCLVFTTQTPGIDELITDGVDGFINQFDNLERLAQQIDQLEQNTPLFEKISQQAQLKISDHFDGKKQMEKYVKVWKSALDLNI
jgi:glycosyltransferase involved in cell wall biosynthesis